MESESTSGILIVGAGLIAIVLHFFFVLSSIAVARARISNLKQEENSGGLTRLARNVLARADTYLLTTQFGRFATAFILGVTVILGSASLPMDWNSWCAPCSVIVIALGVMVIAFLLAQFAKALATNHTEKCIVYVSPLLLFFSKLFLPFHIASKVSNNLLRNMGISVPLERKMVVSVEELSEMVVASSKAGKIEEDEMELLQGVVDFADTVAREVMTPRKDIVAVSENVDLETLQKRFSENGLSRLLVIGEELDQVKGIVIAKDLLPYLGRPADEFVLEDVLRKAHTVPVDMPLDDLLQELQKEAVHFAVVLDEHGGVDGVVTMEDLIEEIVGEIFDESDSPEEEIEITETKDGDLLVDGSAHIDDLNEDHGLALPEGEYDTVAGFVIHQLGRIPEEGEVVSFNGIAITVEELSQNRIIMLRIRHTREHAA